ncbi:sorbosone dehydrogenase family protein [Sphingomonas sp. NSE70-1]|uniref:Sorbosone dehydrogenase family protein n=1 Tax=Sphingomonas caseinilyticus TaxID=2908205 RepID=A0ABT0RT76_9SPHN|nr:sorbosone dehydrogenase family protein [Sphingomonas caseinilyticus]MCL6698199.1 sorbosone dehydrogenase family protein [Sphingomonas caseinilyticus]
MRLLPCSIAVALALTACAEKATRDVSEVQGSNPQLDEPRQTAIPTVNVAKGEGWPAGAKPTPAAGLAVNEFAGGLTHPRWLLALPNGDVLAAESDSPGTDKTGGNVKGFVQKLLMKKAGSNHGSANRISLLRDGDGDGVAEIKLALLSELYSPFGMAFANGELFIANADGIVAYPFQPGQTSISVRPRHVTELPSGYNHHWTKSMVASPDGKFLFVGVGSNSNVGENGLQMEKGRAAIWMVDAKSGAYRIFASGLRNPVGIDWNPWSGHLWTVVNERDELGDNLVPDYLTSVRDGAFYGWPWSYYGSHVDTRVDPPRPDMVAKAIAPDFALGPHVAPLGMTFSDGQSLGARFAQGAFVGEHGSWNREDPSGYQIVFVPFGGDGPSGKPVTILSGFRVGDVARGRPVGVQIARDGSLLVADDVGGKIWRVSAALPQRVASR